MFFFFLVFRFFFIYLAPNFCLRGDVEKKKHCNIKYIFTCMPPPVRTLGREICTEFCMCCDLNSCICVAGKLHWRHCSSCVTGISFGVYEIGTYLSVTWMKRIKWKRSIKLHAILMRMQNFALGIDAPHATNTFAQLSLMKADATHL